MFLVYLYYAPVDGTRRAGHLHDQHSNLTLASGQRYRLSKSVASEPHRLKMKRSYRTPQECGFLMLELSCIADLLPAAKNLEPHVECWYGAGESSAACFSQTWKESFGLRGERIKHIAASVHGYVESSARYGKAEINASLTPSGTVFAARTSETIDLMSTRFLAQAAYSSTPWPALSLSRRSSSITWRPGSCASASRCRVFAPITSFSSSSSTSTASSHRSWIAKERDVLPAVVGEYLPRVNSWTNWRAGKFREDIVAFINWCTFSPVILACGDLPCRVARCSLVLLVHRWWGLLSGKAVGSLSKTCTTQAFKFKVSHCEHIFL